MIAWPNIYTDWRPSMSLIIPVYKLMAQIIAERQTLLILCKDTEEVKKNLVHANLRNIRLISIPFNDTWIRDSGPFIVYEDKTPVVLDYQFNGWGGKFKADMDNEITYELYNRGYFNRQTLYRNRLDFVLEGGAVETNGKGVMVATVQSMLSPGRNAFCGLEATELRIKNDMGIHKIYWLHNGWLEGDDTDGHVDMLARFCDEETVCYVRCEDEKDCHFASLKRMEGELQEMKQFNNKPFRLLPLPMPQPVYDDVGNRLPASYANFLIVNESVLMPLYGVRADLLAKEVLSEAFPGRDVVGINALPLIRQGGSVHCATLQFPRGVL